MLAKCFNFNPGKAVRTQNFVEKSESQILNGRTAGENVKVRDNPGKT